MTIAPLVETLPGTCGLSCLFQYEDDWDWGSNQSEENLKVCLGDSISEAFDQAGIEHVVAGFIDNEVCKTVYDYIVSKCKIVFQSPVKVNKNSGNKFFFIVFTER